MSKLAKISIYFSNDDLGSVFLTRLTGKRAYFYHNIFQGKSKREKSLNLDFLIGGFGLQELGGFSLQFPAFYFT